MLTADAVMTIISGIGTGFFGFSTATVTAGGGIVLVPEAIAAAILVFAIGKVIIKVFYATE